MTALVLVLVVPFVAAAQVTATPGPSASPVPNAPQAVSATVTGSHQVTVSWRPGATNGSAPVVAFRVVGVPGAPTEQVAATATSAVFDDLVPGVQYSFTVRALAADGLQSAAVVANPVLLPAPEPVVAVPPAALPLPGENANPADTPRPCVPYLWPAAISGTPVNYRVGAPQAFFIYELNGYFYLRAYNPGRAVAVLSGTVSANARMTSTGLGLERNDVLRRGARSATFWFRSANDVDAIRFWLPCGTALTFKLYVDGDVVPGTQIFVGRQAVNPVSQPLVIVR